MGNDLAWGDDLFRDTGRRLQLRLRVPLGRIQRGVNGVNGNTGNRHGKT